ncbi:hypothetical protein BU115_07035 [Staphylococcus xylosus]|nr:hypothetical protein BU115_07035 [Staphylococcus xylosus]
MTVVGRVDEIVFNDDNDNLATINSLGNLYDIRDNNDFELWSKSIEDKTESVSEVRIKDLNLGDTIQIPNGKVPLEGKVTSISDQLAIVEIPIVGHRFISDESDFKRIRKASKPLDPSKWLEKAIEDSEEYISKVKSNDLQQRKRNDTVNHPSHYNYGEIEVIDFIEQVTKQYNANVAYHIGNAIKYIARSPHKNGKEDVAKAKWYIERAFENWDVK